MNLADTVIWYLVFTILVGAVFISMGNNIRDSYNITQMNKINEFQESVIRLLQEKNDTLRIDKQKEWFQKYIKSAFLKTFILKELVLPGEFQDNMKFSCYNTVLEGTWIFLWEKVVDLNVDIANSIYQWSDHTGSKWSDFLNFMCFYNTYDHLRSSRSIDSTTSPVAYIIYTFYEDTQYVKKIFSNKWILYFN